MTDIRPIRSNEDYEAALEAVSRLWGSPSGTPEGDDLDVLATLIEAYEQQHFPMGEPSASALAAFEEEQQAQIEPPASETPLIFHLTREETGSFAFHLVAGDGGIVLTSGNFATKLQAMAAIRLLQAGAARSQIIDLAA